MKEKMYAYTQESRYVPVSVTIDITRLSVSSTAPLQPLQSFSYLASADEGLCAVLPPDSTEQTAFLVALLATERVRPADRVERRTAVFTAF